MMNRHTLLIFVLGCLFSEISFSCKPEQGEYLELSVDSSEYVTKPDKSKPAKKSPFGFKPRQPNLYCSVRSGSKCDENSVWFSADDFAKYLVSYKPVHCHNIASTYKVISGVESRTTRFVVYYTDK